MLDNDVAAARSLLHLLTQRRKRGPTLKIEPTKAVVGKDQLPGYSQMLGEGDLMAVLNLARQARPALLGLLSRRDANIAIGWLPRGITQAAIGGEPVKSVLDRHIL